MDGQIYGWMDSCMNGENLDGWMDELFGLLMDG